MFCDKISSENFCFTMFFSSEICFVMFKRVNTDFIATPVDEISDECRFWNQYRHPLNLKLLSRVQSIKFKNLTSHSFLCANSNKLEYFESRNGQTTAFGFQEKVICCDIRKDDAMFSGGDDKGFIRVFGANQKKPLRKIKAHDLVVNDMKFTQNKISLISCSTDLKAKVFDIATGAVTFTYEGFKDKATCLDVKRNSIDYTSFICGSYEKSVRIFDTRADNPVVATIDHKDAVDTVKTFANGTLFASGGGRVVSIWDMRKSSEPLKVLAEHHKHVMDLALNSDETRLLSAGIDRLIKIYDTESFQCVHTLTYPAPILAFDLSNDDKFLAVGMSDESISVKFKVEQKSKDSHEKVSHSQRKRKIMDSLASESEDVRLAVPHIQHEKRPHLTKTEKLLKSFDHTGALKKALETECSQNNETLFSILFEFERRCVLDTVLKGLDLRDTVKLMRYIHESLCNPPMLQLLTSTYGKMLVLHGNNKDFVTHPEINKYLKGSLQKVKNRLKASDEMISFASQFEMLESAMCNHYKDYAPKCLFSENNKIEN